MWSGVEAVVLAMAPVHRDDRGSEWQRGGGGRGRDGDRALGLGDACEAARGKEEEGSSVGRLGLDRV